MTSHANNTERVLTELRRRLTTRLGPEFVATQDELIRTAAGLTVKILARHESVEPARRKAWMDYLVEEFFAGIPWAVGAGPGWEYVKDNPPMPGGWALQRLERV